MMAVQRCLDNNTLVCGGRVHSTFNTTFSHVQTWIHTVCTNPNSNDTSSQTIDVSTTSPINAETTVPSSAPTTETTTTTTTPTTTTTVPVPVTGNSIEDENRDKNNDDSNKVIDENRKDNDQTENPST